jgi:hypothetical protein
MPMRTKYTRDLLKPIVQRSSSFAEIIRQLGLTYTGGTYNHIKRIVLFHQLDTSHFWGKRNNRGPWHCGGPDKKTAKEILILRAKTSYPTPAHQLKRALLEVGVPYKCDVCRLGPEWNGKPLSLQVDHKNGKRWDSRQSNVRFICHNCHSQTANFGGKNTIRNRPG